MQNNKDIQVIDLTDNHKKLVRKKIINYIILFILIIISAILLHIEEGIMFETKEFAGMVTAVLCCMMFQLIRCIIIFIRGR